MRAFPAVGILVLFALTLVSPPAQSAGPSAPLNRSGKPAPGEKKLPWMAFDAATEKAKKENKHMIVDVYTTWCGWCKVMDRQTYGNSAGAGYVLENVVLAEANGDSADEIDWAATTFRSVAESSSAWNE